VKGARCVGAGIGDHEVVAGHIGSRRAAVAGGEIGAGLLGCQLQRILVIGATM
jgi:hypothetical protein